MAVGTSGLIETRLWSVADQLRANSGLKSSEYAIPVLGLIFLVYADYRFSEAEKAVAGAGKGKRRQPGKVDYQAQGVLYLPESARLKTLLHLPEGANIGANINEAMKAIEEENPDLKGVLPRNFNRIPNATLAELLKAVSSIPQDIEGDRFGKIYEYFLGHFAMAEGQKGGEFFTPTSLVKLIVEIIEPYHGRIFDPACGSGGMFVQSARFIAEHQKNPSAELSIFGQEKTGETVRLCKMNLAVHGLGGDIREENTYYNDLHKAVTKKGQPGRFDFVMANPPFNVDKIDKERLEDDPRFPFGLPKPDNGNYLWIQIFYSSLNERGRAGFVMANSASDARGSEMEIRKKIIQDHAVDVMIAIGSNFFYTVTLPCTLWFFDRGKKDTKHKDQVLFIDARHIFTQIDRAHRDFAPEQITNLAAVAKLYRGETEEYLNVLRVYFHEAADQIHAFQRSIEQVTSNASEILLALRKEKQTAKAKANGKPARVTLSDCLQETDIQFKQWIKLAAVVQEFVGAAWKNAIGHDASTAGSIRSAFVNLENALEKANSLIAPTSKLAESCARLAREALKTDINRSVADDQITKSMWLTHFADGARTSVAQAMNASAQHAWLQDKFPQGIYDNVPGMCRVATIDEIKAQSWSLNPGRYVGVADREEDDFDFKERLEELNEELEILNVEARELEAQIAENVVMLLEGE